MRILVVAHVFYPQLWLETDARDRLPSLLTHFGSAIWYNVVDEKIEAKDRLLSFGRRSAGNARQLESQVA